MVTQFINFHDNFSIFELFDLLALICGGDWNHYYDIYVGAHSGSSDMICYMPIEDACIFFLLVCESENISE